MRRVDRRGFTLVEVLIVVVLGGLVLAAVYQTLVTNQKTFTVQAAEIEGQQTLRAGLEVLGGELREISPAEGDLLRMTADSIRLRTLRGFGLACDTAVATDPNLTVKRVGDWLAVGDSVFVFLDGDPNLQKDDSWHSAIVTAVDTTVTCATGTEPAQVVTLGGLVGADTVLPGAPLRSFDRYTYGVYEWNGAPYLGRTDRFGSTEPIVGPLDVKAANPLEFKYLDENGLTTTDPLEVTQIQVTLRTSSDVADAHGDRVQDSVTVRVHTRN